MSYTKGPWQVTGTTVFAGGDYRKLICEAYDPDNRLHSTPVAEANASLIAAAPLLYDALKEAMAYIRLPEYALFVEPGITLEQKLNKALAKAEGKL